MKKWARRGLILLVVSSFVWWTGVPQKAAIEWAAETYGGIVIEIDGGHYLTGPRFDWVSVYLDRDAKGRRDVFVLFEDVRWTAGTKPGRRIGSVQIASMNFYSWEDTEQGWNYRFALDRMDGEKSDLDETWIPESVKIDKITVLGDGVDQNILLYAVSLEAEVHSLTSIDLHFSDSDFTAAWDGYLTDRRLLDLGVRNSQIEVAIQIREESIAIQAEWLDEGSFEAMLQGNLVFTDDGTRLRIAKAALTIHDEGWQELGKIASDDVVFTVGDGEFELSEFDWLIREGSYPTAIFSGNVQDLNVGKEETPLFSGDIHVQEMQLTGGESLRAHGSVRVGDDLAFDLSAQCSDESQLIRILFEDWSRSALVELTPEDFQEDVSELAFDALSGDVEIEVANSRFSVTSTIKSTSSSGDSPVGLQVSLEGETGRVAGTTGTLALTLGEGKVTGDGRMTEAGDYEANLTVESMPLRPFALLAAGTRLPEEVSGTLDGTVTMRQAADSVEAVVTPFVVLSNVVYEGEEQPDFTLAGLIRADTETRIATSDSLTVSTDYDEVSLSMSGLHYDLNTGDLSSEVEYAFDLGWVDALGDLGGAYGMLKGTGSFSGSEGAYSMPFVAESNDLGYGDALSLYDILFTANGTLQYLEENGRFDLIDMHMTVGEGTSAEIAQASYEDSVLRGEAVVQSDLNLLVEMAYVESVDANVKSIAAWVIDEENTQIDWSTSGTVAEMTLMEKAGTVENVSYELAGKYGEVLSGEGTLSVAALSSMGATIHGFNGSLGFEEDALVISNVRSEVFGGTLESRVALAVLEEGIPVRYEGEFASVDLARMTEEVQPPNTTMTGIAFGDIEADYSIADGLLAFELDVQSNEGFTINRSLVEEMMQMQTVLKGLGEKRAEKTMAKFLGENPQRPFDTARMTVFLWEGVIEGVSELKSAKTRDYNGLNLTIQLSIDQPALVQSLKMLEDSGVTDFEF